jgi:hypothetical protein
VERRSLVAHAVLELTYLLPLRSDGESIDELALYLRHIATTVDDVVVVDGSAAAERRAHQHAFGGRVRVLEPEERTLMGKVGNVMTGMRVARHNKVVIADDDVRYTEEQLARVGTLLQDFAVVRPQNYFVPLPWHARVDAARTLLARVSGGDWPGTLGVQRDALVGAGGYAGDVMFENLQLVRTVRAVGGREHVALDLLVRRRPPTASHFRAQQVRQAYDELARPERLVVSLAIAPLCAWAAVTRRWHVLAFASIIVAMLAEAGRRRAGGREVFPASSSLLAPPWTLWRSLCSWAAIGARLRGGVRYRGVRIKHAARAPRLGSRARSSSGTPRSSASSPLVRRTIADARRPE